MTRKTGRKERGIYEKDRGSGIWWIRYYHAGVERREKAGRRSDALKLYALRKADALRGVKLPSSVRITAPRFEVIGAEAIDWYTEHGRKDVRNFKARMRTILVDFGHRIADDIKPSEIDAWLSQHAWSPATKNRYKNVFGKTFKIALADGKVSGNPARAVEQRPERNARIRYLHEDEERRLRAAILRRFPHHMPLLEIALHTGMRKGEQYTLEWSQVSLERRRIILEATKNGSGREIPMNQSCLRAFRELNERRPHNGRVCQSTRGKDLNNSRAWFERVLREAQIDSFRWHDLRHTFVSRLVMRGVDLRTVQELAGHKTISMTIRYAHLAPEHNQAAIEKLDPRGDAEDHPLSRGFKDEEN